MRKIGKKSQHEIMFIVFQLMMIAAIFASLMFYVGSLKNQTLFKKLALSRDLALVTNILYAAPGNIDYTYSTTNLNFSEFEYNLKDQLVQVIEEGRETVYPYGDDLLFETVFRKISGSNTIQFQNTGYLFLSRKQREAKPDLFKCPYVEAKDKGKVVVGFYNENPLANQIAAELKADKEGVGRITTADTLIIADIDTETYGILKIEIPANPQFIKQSRKLASLIANNAFERGNIDYVFIIPSTNNDLNKAKTAVYIKLSKDAPIIDISQPISKSLEQWLK
ncbi:hypothetical protein KY343_00710 [Candidatus Woesearchaeota archaeon]|nr:hypothetical protein [Candidatus Woesearchaeota archaeon]